MNNLTILYESIKFSSLTVLDKFDGYALILKCVVFDYPAKLRRLV